MKKLIISISLLTIMALLTACIPGLSGSSEESLEFSEEAVEAAMEDSQPDADSENAESEEGFDFTTNEDDGNESEDSLDFTIGEDENVDSENGYEFTEEEVEEDAPEGDPVQEDAPEMLAEPMQASPPEGNSVWRITNEIGSLECPGITIEVGPEIEEEVFIEAAPAPDPAAFTVQGLGDLGEGDYIAFYYANPAVYDTEGYIPPGGSSEVVYEITFYYDEGGEYNIIEEADGKYIANYLEGTIQGTFEETIDGFTGQCELFRTFYGELEGLY